MSNYRANEISETLRFLSDLAAPLVKGRRVQWANQRRRLGGREEPPALFGTALAMNGRQVEVVDDDGNTQFVPATDIRFEDGE